MPQSAVTVAVAFSLVRRPAYCVLRHCVAAPAASAWKGAGGAHRAVAACTPGFFFIVFLYFHDFVLVVGQSGDFVSGKSLM
jgi:hypothetical protein